MGVRNVQRDLTRVGRGWSPLPVEDLFRPRFVFQPPGAAPRPQPQAERYTCGDVAIANITASVNATASTGGVRAPTEHGGAA